MLLALQMYEESLCPGGCGEPKHHAWHSELDGHYEGERLVCHACTAKNDGEQVVYVAVRSLYPEDRLPLLTPLEIGVNTTPPTDN